MASDYIKIASGCSSNSVLRRFEELEIYMAVQLRLYGSISRKINFRKFAKSGRNQVNGSPRSGKVTSGSRSSPTSTFMWSGFRSRPIYSSKNSLKANCPFLRGKGSYGFRFSSWLHARLMLNWCMGYWLTVWHDHTCTRAHKVITRAHARAHNHYQKYLAFLEQIPKCSIRIHFLITQRKLLLETLFVFWRLILVYIDQSYSLLVIDLQGQVPQNLVVLILMASEAVVESSENVSEVWRRATLHGAEVSSVRQSSQLSQGRSGGGAEKGSSSQAMVSNKWRISF